MGLHLVDEDCQKGEAPGLDKYASWNLHTPVIYGHEIL